MIHDVYATKINPSDYNTKPLKKRLSKQGKPVFLGIINAIVKTHKNNLSLQKALHNPE